MAGTYNTVRPTYYADTINGSGIALSGLINPWNGQPITVGAACYVANGDGAGNPVVWTCEISTAAVDHSTVEAVAGVVGARWIKSGAFGGGGGGGTITSITSSGGTIVVTNPSGPTVNVEAVPQFGSDTLVQLPNSSSVNKTVLELVASYTSNTAGAEASKWLVKLLSGGAQTTALDLRPAQVLLPSGTSGAPAVSFQADATSGMYYTGGTPWITSAGVPKLQILNNGVAISSQSPLWLGTDYVRGIKGVSNDIVLFGDSNFQIGDAGALATSATVGFLSVPTCAGTPTGAVTPASGKAFFLVDTTGSKLWVRFGGAWKSVAVA